MLKFIVELWKEIVAWYKKSVNKKLKTADGGLVGYGDTVYTYNIVYDKYSFKTRPLDPLDYRSSSFSENVYKSKGNCLAALSVEMKQLKNRRLNELKEKFDKQLEEINNLILEKDVNKLVNDIEKEAILEKEAEKAEKYR